MFSIVAVTSKGEIAGHLALTRRGKARIGELGRAVVNPEFRSMGIFTRLNQFAVNKARSEGLLGILGEAVTNHTYSQQVGLGIGLRIARYVWVICHKPKYLKESLRSFRSGKACWFIYVPP